MKKIKKVAADSKNEAKLTEEIIEYCVSNYKEPVNDEDAIASDAYYEREGVIKGLIDAKYPSIEDSYKEYIIEAVYSKLYNEQT